MRSTFTLILSTLAITLTLTSTSTWTANAQTVCKYNGGLACPQEKPCCSSHGHCGNSDVACGVGCNSVASFNGECKQFKDANNIANKFKTTNNGKPNTVKAPVPSLPKGSFKVVGLSGVAAQHIALVNPNRMLIIDKVEDNPARLPDGSAAHVVEYDLDTNKYRVLDVKTNTFCSGGGFLGNGTMISAGGAEKRNTTEFGAESGFQSLRMWEPCEDKKCEFIENPVDPAWQLTGKRWYVSVTTLPSGNLFILGGSLKSLAVNRNGQNNPTWEIYPRPPNFEPVLMQFLVDAMPNNLYPNVYTLPDGNLYIFANQKSIIYNMESREVIKTLPDIPGGPRSYPLTGSHVLLPLDPAKNYAHEILVCGGSETMSTRSKALQTCGRINLHSPDPQWEMDQMPSPRLMSDAVILPDGKIMLVNGCKNGYAGFLRGSNPVFAPTIYDPNAPLGERFSEWAPSNIPRMYHSVAALLPDGSIFVAGSNENSEVRYKTVPFPTEYRVEIFTPPYLTTDLARPEIVSEIPKIVYYDQSIQITVDVQATDKYAPEIVFMLGRRGFVTHSQQMSQRMIKLVVTKVREQMTFWSYSVAMPPNANLMPPGPHYIHVLNNGVPSKAIHILLNHK